MFQNNKTDPLPVSFSDSQAGSIEDPHFFGKYILSVVLGLVIGYFILKTLPLANLNIYFLFALPVAAFVFFLFVLNVKSIIVLLLFSRCVLDPFLDTTKISVGGENTGLGAAINLSVIGLGLFFALRDPMAVFRNKVCKAWVIFLAVCGLSLLFTPALGKGLKTFFSLFSYLCMIIIPFQLVKSVKDQKFWVKIIVASSVLPVILANLDLIQGGTSYLMAGSRIKGSFSHPNMLAFYLVLAISLVFYVVKSRLFNLSIFQKLALYLYLLNLVGLLLATKTRNAWISCWLFFLVYGLMKSKKIIAVCLLLPPLLLLSPTVQERARDMLINKGTDLESGIDSFSWRVELWKRALGYMKNDVVMGNGLASFRALSREFFPENAAPHNVYLEVFFETGLMGLLAYLFIYFSIFRTFRKQRKRSNALSVEHAVVIAYVSCYIFSCAGDNMHDILAFNWYFWFFLGVMLKFIQIKPLYSVRLKQSAPDNSRLLLYRPEIHARSLIRQSQRTP